MDNSFQKKILECGYDKKTEILSRIKTQIAETKEEFKEALIVMKEIFTDPNDLATDEEFSEMFLDPDIARFYVIRDGNKPVGMELAMINRQLSAVYIPYAGLVADYRNLGIYPRVVAIHDEQMKLLGKDHVLYEFENPSSVTSIDAYSDEDTMVVAKRCEARINFWRQSLGCLVIDDLDVPYCRPASNDSKKIQTYDLLAFRPFDKDNHKWKEIFKKDGTAISREAYERLYLEIMQLEYGLVSKEKLRAEYPAINKFFLQLESQPDKKWISLYNKPSYQKPHY